MTNKNLFLKIYIFLLLICILFLITFSILGIIKRTGYLSNFELNIYNILEINGLDIEETKRLFTVDNALDNDAFINYIFTNEHITNYSYNFRVQYYNKVFRNSDLYNVYIDIDKTIDDNDSIKEIKMNEKGSPFGTLISDKKLDYDEKIDNINYTLLLKARLIIYIVVVYIILFFLIVFCLEKILTIINTCLEKIGIKLLFKNAVDSIFNMLNTVSNNITIHREYIISFVVFFPFVIIIYQFLGYSFPYYYSWDSTKIWTNDVLLVLSNIMPEFFLCSNFIFFLLYKYIFIPFAKLFNLISIVNISQLENSLNPYLSFVELFEYILLVQQILFLIFIAFLYINIVKIMKIHNYTNKKIILYIISFLFVLSLSIILHTTFGYNTIRFESNGLFLCLISLYFILSASEINIDSRNHRIYIILSGIFIGLALFIKILFIYYMAFLYFIYIIFNFNKYINYNNDNVNFSTLLKILFCLLIFSIFMSISIIIYSQNKLLNTAFAEAIIYTEPVKLILSLSIFPLILLVLFIFVYLINKNKLYVSCKLKILIYNFLIHLFSFSSIIFLSLLLPEKFNSIIYAYLFSYGGGSTIMWKSINNHYLIILLISIVVLSFVFIKYFNFFYKYIRKLIYLVKNVDVLRIILSIFLIFIPLLSNRFTRADERDFVLLNTMYIMSFFILYKSILDLQKYRKLLLISLIFILSIYSVVNINRFNDYNSKLVPNQVITDKSAYIYTQSEWKYMSYGLNASKIADIMNRVYTTDELWDSVFYWSKNVQMLKRLIKQVEIKNNSLLYTSIANTNSVISYNSDIISSIDNNIKGGILIPLTDISNNVYLRDDYDFYYISDTEYKKNDLRMTYLDYDFSVNEKKYFVYKLSMSNWMELKYGYNGDYVFIKNEDFTNAFILINDKLAKKL